MRFTLSALLSLLIWITQAAAQDAPLDSPLEPTRLTQMRLLIERDPNGFLAQVISQLFRAAPDGRLTADAATTFIQIEAAGQRSRVLAQMLAFDLDGDFVLSSGELGTLRAALTGARRAELEAMVALADGDGDGAVSTDELAARAQAQVRERGGRWGDPDTLLAFDLDGDDAVTVEELREAVRRVAAGDRPVAVCVLPVPGAEAESASFPTDSCQPDQAEADNDEKRPGTGETPSRLLGRELEPVVTSPKLGGVIIPSGRARTLPSRSGAQQIQMTSIGRKLARSEMLPIMAPTRRPGASGAQGDRPIGRQCSGVG